MPEAFDKCARGGGRVRTKKLKKKRHIKVCFPRGGGSSVAGHAKITRGKARRRRS